ncbi:MAG: HPr family phosphocarrier protein [Acidobacteria bacterium]|nr:HPr family phosphocarrier protein [Acidobacteriota bacterium]
MIVHTVKLTNRLGLHARAAAKLVHLAGQFSAEITLALDGESVDAKSILGILLLAAVQGSDLTLSCDGVDEDSAATALTDLIESRFGEPE